MKCDIIIPVWNQPEHTKSCIEAIYKNTAYPYRLILIDNGSGDETRAYLEALKAADPERVEIIRNKENLGYVKAVNQGMRASKAPYVCLMNNDTLPGPGWLERLVGFAGRHKEIGLMNPLMDGHGALSVDEYAVKVAKNGPDAYMEMNQCFGFCALVKREVIDKIGYLDEAFGMGGYDDTDYSMRAWKAGYFCASVHSSYVYHKQHVSFRAMGVRDSASAKGQEEYSKKWPRHLRVAVSFRVDKDTPDEAVGNMLKSVLFMAREWCWVNLSIFGGKKYGKERLAEISAKMKMPSHQNIKMNFLNKNFSAAQFAARVLERSFGTKKRKRYDAVMVCGGPTEKVLKFLRFAHKAGIIAIDPGDSGAIEMLRKELANLRS